MNGWTLLSVAGLVLAGCGEEQARPSGAQGVWSTSGSRLQTRVLRSAAGLAVPYDVFDSKLDVPCVPAAQPDGAILCLPDVRTVTFGVYFRDAGCSEPIVFSTSAKMLRAGALVMYVTTTGCFRKLQSLARVTGRLVPGTPVFRREVAGVCLPGVIPEHSHIYDVNVVADRPVVLTAERIDLDGRMAARVLVGEDGSRIVPGDLYDTRLDTPVLADGTDRLLPPRADWGQARRRDAPPDQEGWKSWCEGRGDFLPYDRCSITPVLTHVAMVDGKTPGAPLEVFAVNHRLETSHRCEWGNGEVVQLQSLAREGVLLGDPVPTERLVRGERVNVGDGRLIRLQVDEADRAVAIGGRLALRAQAGVTPFQDTELNLRCRPTPVADGNIRCLPDAKTDPLPPAVARPVYLDAACTELVARARRMDSHRPRYVTVPYALTILAGERPRPTRVFPVEDPLPDPPPPLFVINFDDICAPAETSPLDQVFRVGAEVPPETFAPLTIETR